MRIYIIIPVINAESTFKILLPIIFDNIET
jgi:hypothetical protein